MDLLNDKKIKSKISILKKSKISLKNKDLKPDSQ